MSFQIGHGICGRSGIGVLVVMYLCLACRREYWLLHVWNINVLLRSSGIVKLEYFNWPNHIVVGLDMDCRISAHTHISYSSP